MATTGRKVTARPAAVALDGTELFPGVQDAASVKILAEQIREFVLKLNANGKSQFNGAITTSALFNIVGTNLISGAPGYYCFTVTNNTSDATNKGGAVLTCAPYMNANNPWMVLGPWSTNAAHIIYYGGGGWGVPDVTDHWFYSGAYTPGSPNTSTTAFRIEQGFVTSYRHTRPAVDNTYSLGTSALKWSVVYAATGTIDTSDEREKTVEGPVPLGLDFVLDLQPVAYKWKVGGYDINKQFVEAPEDRPDVGDVAVDVPVERPGTRTHYGLIAQQVKAQLDARSLDFAGWTLSDKDDPDSQQGLRYSQFIPILIKAVQELSDKNEALEARITALENGG